MALWHNSIARYAIYAVVLLRNGLREDTSIQAEMREKIFRQTVDPLINETCYYRWNVLLELDLILFLCALLFTVVSFKVCRELSKHALRRRQRVAAAVVVDAPRVPANVSAIPQGGVELTAPAIHPLNASVEEPTSKAVRKRKPRRSSPAPPALNALESVDAAAPEDDGEWQIVSRRKNRKCRKLPLEETEIVPAENKESQAEAETVQAPVCDNGLGSHFEEVDETSSSEFSSPSDRLIGSEAVDREKDPSDTRSSFTIFSIMTRGGGEAMPNPGSRSLNITFQ